MQEKTNRTHLEYSWNSACKPYSTSLLHFERHHLSAHYCAATLQYAGEGRSQERRHGDSASSNHFVAFCMDGFPTYLPAAKSKFLIERRISSTPSSIWALAWSCRKQAILCWVCASFLLGFEIWDRCIVHDFETEWASRCIHIILDII